MGVVVTSKAKTSNASSSSSSSIWRRPTEIEEPTIELTEEMVTVNLTTQEFPAQRAESRSHERASLGKSYLTPESSQRSVGGETTIPEGIAPEKRPGEQWTLIRYLRQGQ